jgi:hypothetical protein
MRFFISIFLLTCLSVSGYSQLGGSYTYSFLDLTNSARVASLGGKTNAIWDNDLNLAFQNPALLSSEMKNHLVLNYVNYFSDINFGYVSYANTIDKIGNVAAGLHFINYGEFIAADHLGNKTGTFTASEYALNLIWSKSYDSLFHFGINVKPVYSSMEKYRSFGLVADIGLTYTNREKLFVASIVMRNIGYQIKPYHDQNREPMPFEIQMGLSQKLKHAPFRFSFVYHNLQQFDLTYKTGQSTLDFDPLTGETIKENKIEIFADKLMRHMIFGVEFIPFESFILRAGYNYQRRMELKLDTQTAMVGFSWGFGLKIYKFHLSYGRASYHLAGASNHFSLSTNLSSFYTRR